LRKTYYKVQVIKKKSNTISTTDTKPKQKRGRKEGRRTKIINGGKKEKKGKIMER